jgi:hypothetical protein
MVYPWYGKALDFSDGVNLPNGQDYGPLISYCDKSNTWPRVYAIVDPGASSSTGKAVTTLAAATNGTAIPFGTIADAMNACGATNKAVFNNNSLENCFILCTNGNYAVWGGPNIVSRNPSRTWTTIGARPDVDWHSVIITNVNNGQTGDKTLKIRISKMICGVSAGVSTFSQGYGDVLIDSSEVWTNTLNVALISSTTNTWLRQTVIRGMRNFPNPSFNQGGGSWAKVRGCTFTSFDGVDGNTTTINPALFIGSAVVPYTNDTYSFANDVTLTVDPVIWAFNKFMNGSEVVYQVKLGIETNINIGAAFVQNLIESAKSGPGIPLDVMYSGRANEWCTNVLIWNNTVVGKYHPPYNLNGFWTVSSDHYMDANNVFASKEVRFDVSDFNGNATNRWAEMFGVGCFNNVSTQIGLSPGTTIGQDNAGRDLGFDGISSYFNITTNSFAFRFVANNSWCGGNSNGLGDYHLQSTSPVVAPPFTGVGLLPYDIEGVARTDTDPPGAYATVINTGFSAVAPLIKSTDQASSIGGPEIQTTLVPQLHGLTMVDGKVRLSLSGRSGQRFRVLASEDLINWHVVGEVVLNGTTTEFIDIPTPVFSSQYYRLASP